MAKHGDSSLPNGALEANSLSTLVVEGWAKTVFSKPPGME